MCDIDGKDQWRDGERSATRYLDSRERVHLLWMFENQPDLVRELYRDGKLRQHLDKKNQEVLRYVDLLKKERGLSEDEAFEIATQVIAAPADGPAIMNDAAPEPIPYQEQEAIMEGLTAVRFRNFCKKPAMKAVIITVVLTLAAASFTLLGWSLSNRNRKPAYEYHTALNGLGIWRCNTLTGETDFCSTIDKVWRRVPELRPTSTSESQATR